MRLCPPAIHRFIEKRSTLADSWLARIDAATHHEAVLAVGPPPSQVANWRRIDRGVIRQINASLYLQVMQEEQVKQHAAIIAYRSSERANSLSSKDEGEPHDD